MNPIRAWWQARQRRYETRARYWEAEAKARSLHMRLEVAAEPDDRARLLARLARAEQTMGQLEPDAFGFHPRPREVVEHAHALLQSGVLLSLLADVERAVAYPRLGRRHTTTHLERVAGEVLDRMAATSDLTGRTHLLKQLADAVGPVVDGQAVETLWCLPSPGHSGWMTHAEKKDWRRYRDFGWPVSGQS